MLRLVCVGQAFHFDVRAQVVSLTRKTSRHLKNANRYIYLMNHGLYCNSTMVIISFVK